MLFNSWQFIAFFISIFLLYFLLPYRFRNMLLLVASYAFYMAWKWQFAFLMLGVSALNFYTGKKIAETELPKKQRFWLCIALTFSLAPLVYFKYANFFIENFTSLFSTLGFQVSNQLLNVILPVGISFFTFQALSYSFDVYNKKTTVEPNFVNFAVFVSFFPQLVAGPIERSSNLLKQFRVNHTFDSYRFIEGSKLFIWGLFKKIVIADRLAIYVDAVYNNPGVHSGATLLVATLFFTFQIYCDFSGYSDMAIGAARILGFNLMQNFNLPYLAKSISEFWKRWHISLSTWFADYVYIPMGGNRVKTSRWIFNIFVVFVVSGLWHGANWTFIIWGALHAFYYLLEYLGKQGFKIIGKERIMQLSAYKGFKIVITFMLVVYAWIFFRANSIQDALFISHKIFDWSGQLWWGSSSVTSLLSIALIAVLIVVQIMQYKGILALYFKPAKVLKPLQWFAFLVMLISIALFGMSSNAFIYFQF